MSGGYELISLRGEYGKHLSSVVLTNYNHLHVLLYDLIPTNLSYFCNTLSKIRSLIKFCENTTYQSVNTISSINGLLTNSRESSNPGSQNYLNQINCKLKQLQTFLPDLYDSYGYINYLRIEAEKIITSPIDPPGPNSNISRLIQAFSCSLSEFDKIECLVFSAKSTINEITESKNMIMASLNIVNTQALNSACLKIKCLSDNIDRISSSICDIEFYTLCLKYWICKFISTSNQNSLSSLSVNYIRYFYQFYSILIKNFPNLFPKDFLTLFDNLIKYLDCSLIKFNSYFNTHLSSISSSLISNLSDIQSLTLLVTELRPLIKRVLGNLKTAIGLNITLVCIHITPIFNSIKICRETLPEAIKIINCMNNLINTKCNTGIFKCFKDCLNQIRFKLIEQQTEACKLYNSYWCINCLVIRTQDIIICCQDIFDLKISISGLTRKFECSITQFNKIESCIKGSMRKIEEISKLKQKLYKDFEKILLLICISNQPGRLSIVIINGNDLKKKMECLSQKIDQICSEFTKIEAKTTGLKHSLVFNWYYFQISSYILTELKCIDSEQIVLLSLIIFQSNFKSAISVISDNIKDIRTVIGRMDESKDDLSYIKESLWSIIPKLCKIKESSEQITIKIPNIQCVIEALKKIKSSVDALKKLECDQKCLQIFDFPDTKLLKQSLICIRDKLEIKCITDKLVIVEKSLCIFESLLLIKNDFDTLFFDMKYIVGWIDEVEKSPDNIVNRFIRCSTQSLSNHVTISNITGLGILEMNNVVMNLSRIVIDESIFVLSRLYMYYNIKSQIDEIFQFFEHCPCYKFYNIIYKIGVKDIQLPDATHLNDNPHLKLHLKNKMINEGNYLCLCLVVRYILLNDLYVLIRYNEYVHMDLLSCMSRNYKKHSYSVSHNIDISKLILLIITTLYKIINWMRKKFIEGESDVPFKIRCFCLSVNNIYYESLISIILFISSLIENLWSIDNQSIRMAIECLSSLIPIISQMGDTNVLEGHESSLSHLGFYDKQVTKHFNIVGSSIYISDNLLGLSMTITDDYNKLIHKSENNCSLFTKPFIQSLISSISNIRISGPRFNLFYQSFTFFSHYILIKSSSNEETKHWINKENKNLSYAYLSINAQKKTCNPPSTGCTVCENVRERIIYYIICVARGKFRTISSQITSTGIIKFIQQNNELKLYEIINYFNTTTIDDTEMILRITKNNITSNNYQILNTKNTVESTNWGYDTQYEHFVTKNSSNPNDHINYIKNHKHMLDLYYIVYSYLLY